jgi:signal transduction histidine kinase
MTGLSPGREVGQAWARMMHRVLQSIPHVVYAAEGPPWEIVAERGTLSGRVPLGDRVSSQWPHRVRTPEALHLQMEGAPGILVGLGLAPDRAGPLSEPLIRLGVESFRLLWGDLQQNLMSKALAHEIRNPLMLVSGYAEILALREESEVSAGILAEVGRINERIEDFLDAGRPLALDEVDLADIVRRALAHYLPWAERQRVAVHEELNRAIVWGDARSLENVVTNLLRNALESMPDGGRLFLTSGMVGGGGEVIVRDTGPGVAREVRDNLFRPYFSTKPEGHGLGLALAWDIAARHGGRLDLWPSEVGAAFRLWIPREPHPTGPSGRLERFPAE